MRVLQAATFTIIRSQLELQRFDHLTKLAHPYRPTRCA
jgi:hypothetical protein